MHTIRIVCEHQEDVCQAWITQKGQESGQDLSKGISRNSLKDW